MTTRAVPPGTDHQLARAVDATRKHPPEKRVRGLVDDERSWLRWRLSIERRRPGRPARASAAAGPTRNSGP
jgi:hypothetical protein